MWDAVNVKRAPTSTSDKHREDGRLVSTPRNVEPWIRVIRTHSVSAADGAVLLSKHPRGEGVPVAGRLNDVKFKRMIRPGDTILIEAILDDRMGDAFFLSAKVTCEGKPAVTLNFAVTLAKREVT